MNDVIYKIETGVDMLGHPQYIELPTCPVCSELTYGENTCPFCRMKGICTPLKYNGSRSPRFFSPEGKEVKPNCSHIN